MEYVGSTVLSDEPANWTKACYMYATHHTHALINLICTVVQTWSTLEYTARMLYIATEYGAYDKSETYYHDSSRVL